jgi:hypothetical protein
MGDLVFQTDAHPHFAPSPYEVTLAWHGSSKRKPRRKSLEIAVEHRHVYKFIGL